MCVELSSDTLKKGYLNSDFRIFHIKDHKAMEFESHYHEFYKIIILVSGKVTYLIEGVAYELKPYDILFINKNDIHKSQVAGSEIYERYVLWMSGNFLNAQSSCQWDLTHCFSLTSEKKAWLMRLNEEDLQNIRHLLYHLETAESSQEFGSTLLLKAVFVELMVYLNRYCLVEKNMNALDSLRCDETISSLIEYINLNLVEDLSTENLAYKFYMSKYRLMHKFKEQTGYSLHKYILKKRLLKANLLLSEGCSVASACQQCGFGDYSNFIRSYKSMYGIPPKRHHGNQSR